MFGNQVCFIVGLSFAPAHVASIWQATQPIITVVVTIMIHMESKSWRKILGILLSASGAFVVAFFSGGGSTGRSILIGSFFFFVNCFSNSLFVVLSKPLVKKYPAVTITSLSYNICSVLVMLVGICMYWSRCSMILLILRQTVCMGNTKARNLVFNILRSYSLHHHLFPYVVVQQVHRCINHFGLYNIPASCNNCCGHYLFA